MTKQSQRSVGFEMTVSILDFVTICLGATLLLVIMVPAHQESRAVFATKAHALELVRKHFARQTRQTAIRLAEDLVAAHPSLPAPGAYAPRQLEGMSLSILDERQRVRRSELLVQTANKPEILIPAFRVALTVMKKRGIGYITMRSVSHDNSASSSESSIGRALGAAPSETALANTIIDAIPISGEAALKATTEAASNSPTPSEPILVLVHNPHGIDLIKEAVKVTTCPSSGLLIIGPPLTANMARSIQNIMTRCDRLDYMGVKP